MEQDFYKTTSLNDAINKTGLSLPSNINQFPSDVKAYIYLRIITAAINSDNGTDMFTAEKARCYPFGNYTYQCAVSFPYWNSGTTHFYCGSRIGLKSDVAAEYCINNFREYWQQLVASSNVSMSLPSNIESLLPDVQAYIRLRISAASINGANGGGTYFPCFRISSGEPEDIVGIRKKSGGEAKYQNRIRVANFSFCSVIKRSDSLTNLGLLGNASAETSANNNFELWKQLVGVVL